MVSIFKKLINDIREDMNLVLFNLNQIDLMILNNNIFNNLNLILTELEKNGRL